MTTAAGVPMQRSSRDPQVVRRRLEEWLGARLDSRIDPGSTPRVSDLRGTEANGMSSDTMLFRASWSDAEGDHDEPLVARVAPDAHDVPVFPSYDMQAQFDAIRLVHELTDVPVPEPRWCDPGGAALGAPMFVMAQVDGLVPPDNLPYPFGDNWLYDASPVDRQRLQDSTVAAIAALHAIDDAPRRFPFLERTDPGEDHLRRHLAHTRAWYDMVAAEGARSPLVEAAFGWLDAHLPDDIGPTVLSWGDSRIGNVIYRDFTPVALLDWEMAGLGPRELDLAWLAYGHQVFQDLATALELPGMPGFLRVDDVAAAYESHTGHTPRHLRWFCVYAAVQWGTVFLRTGHRSAHFGERTMPDDPEDLIFTKAHLQTLLADRGLDD
jgi:aminoglycoside phosphotransferase (APT) family kinase protein